MVLRHPDRRGPLFARVFEGFGIPVAVEASVPLARTAAGRGLAALARASLPEGSGEDLLAFMRARPGEPQGIGDWVERRLLRGEARHRGRADRRLEGAALDARPRFATPAPGGEWLRALAAAAHELAEEAHAGREPVDGPFGGDRGATPCPSRRSSCAPRRRPPGRSRDLAELDAMPGCAAPSPAEALELLEDVRVPLWRGPTEGRVRVLSPYRARAARARHLFVASLQDGEFPGGDTGDPLLGDERRRRLGIAALVRQEEAIEERYLFHACACRPTERLWLCWRSSDEEGRPATRSPFVDEVLDLLAPGPEEAEESAEAGPRPGPRRSSSPREAPGARDLQRSLAARGPRSGEDLPGPLADPGVLAELARRDPVGPGTIEKWIECPYRWFVDHELSPQRLEPQPEHLTAGSIVHEVLERLYSEPPGDDRIPRPGDVARWRERAATCSPRRPSGRGWSPACRRRGS